MSEATQQDVSGGWTNDSVPSRQPQNTVRKLKNMRIVSDQNNTFAAESLLGTFNSFSLNPNYFPIGWSRCVSTVVILSTKDLNGVDTNGEIGVATIDPVTLLGTYIPLYNHASLAFNSSHQIESWTYDENESIRRVYWTDNYNPLRALNLFDPRFTTYFNQAAVQAAVGSQFMVLTDNVTNGTDTYGPNESAGTVFTSDGTEVFNGSPLVIEYVNVSLLDVVPSRDQGNIVFNRWLPNGNLLGGSYQYCYQLTTNDGIVTNFSYVSMAFHSPDNTVPSSATIDYQKLQGLATNFSTQKGIRILIDNIDQDFDNIRVVSVRTTSLNSTDVPKIIFDGPISGTSMFFDHNGNEQLGSLSAADLETVVLAIEQVRTGAMLKQKFFIGDVKLSPFIPFDNTGVAAKSIEYRYPSDTIGRPDATTDSTTSALNGHAYMAATTPSYIATDQWYEVLTGTITYNAVVYNAGDTFIGVSTVHSYSGTGTFQAIIKIQKYTGAYKIIPILDDFMDTKSAAVATHLRSLWRGETYRYGILFYDRFQNPQYVQWLMDWQVPNHYDTTDPSTGNALTFNPRLSEEIANDYGAGISATSLRSIGINFSGLDFNAVAASLGVSISDLGRYIGGFSIVRAPRDPQVLAQGILAPTVIDGNNTRPVSTTTLANDKYGAANGRRPYTYTFFSPEFLFQYNNLPNVQVGDILKVQDYLNDTYRQTPEGTLETNNYHFYEKFYDSVGAPGGYPAKGSTNEIDNTKSFNMAVGASGQSYDPAASLLFENRSATAAFVWGAERECTGSWTELFVTLSSESTTYPNGFAAVDGNRSLVNFIRPKGNLYGGQSDAAKAATAYIYCGHYQPMDADFIAYLQGNAGVADDIEVFGGDAFVCIFDLARMIKDESNVALQASFGLTFPVETAINVSLRQGRHLSKDRSYDSTQPTINTNGICYASPTQVESFVYNTAYSYNESFFAYAPVPLGFSSNSWYKRRVYGSLTKTDGERIDSFRVFPINDYKDLDGRNGELFNLRAKSGRLFYWQESAFGYIPTYERETISNSLGQPVTIGNGGVLERFDDIENYYGNQHQFGLGESEDQFYWYDALRKELVLANVGGSSGSLSTAKGLRAFFQRISGECLANDNPVRNRGIAAQYNPAIKEMMIAFRGVTGSGGGDLENPLSPSGFTIGFDNINRQFTGQFDLLPGIMLEFNNKLLLSFTGAYSPIAPSTAYTLGSLVNDGTTVYACILAYTSAGLPIDPSADATHWTEVCKINEVHIADASDVCKFFGYVYPCQMQVISNPMPGRDKVFDNQQMEAGSDFFDTATYSDSVNSTTEQTSGGFYEYINKTWYWSVPFTPGGDRFRDHYMQIDFEKDNRLSSNPTVSSNKRLKIVSLVTHYRKTI